jgi:hypothetical protein
MSRVNKVNKGNYVQRGRLTPDDMAREQTKERAVASEQVTAQERERPRRGARGASRPRSAPSK